VIELLSAAVVYWRFRREGSGRWIEDRTSRLAGGLLFALATFLFVASSAVLLGYGEVRPSLVGMVLLIAAAFVMPWLAKEKQRMSAVTSSAALKADAAESAICGYMAWIALAGLLLNAVWKIRWADPLAALCLIPIILHEGWEAIRGKHCGDC